MSQRAQSSRIHFSCLLWRRCRLIKLIIQAGVLKGLPHIFFIPTTNIQAKPSHMSQLQPSLHRCSQTCLQLPRALAKLPWYYVCSPMHNPPLDRGEKFPPTPMYIKLIRIIISYEQFNKHFCNNLNARFICRQFLGNFFLVFWDLVISCSMSIAYHHSVKTQAFPSL